MGKAKIFFVKYSSASAIILLFVSGIAIYANSFSNQMFWDDNDGILNNTYVKNFEIKKFFTENLIAGAGFQSNYWRPMLLLTYAAEWKIWGEWTYGYHAVNTLIHIGNAILLFFILAYISKSFFIRFFTSLIFLIHPLQTEAVTYVSGRGDPLSFFFILLGIIFYTKYRNKTEEKKSTYFYFGALFVFILALLTKERAVIFPAYLILFELWYWYKEKINFKKFIRKLAISLLPFILIACIYLLLRGTALNFQNTFNIYNTDTPYTESILVRTYTFLKTLPEYFGLYFFPKTLFMERSEAMSYTETIFNPYVLMGICISLILTFFSFFKFKEKPEYAFGLMFLFIAFFPASGIIVPVAGIMFEHYMYAPIIGLSFILAIFFSELFSKIYSKTSSKTTQNPISHNLTFSFRSERKCKVLNFCNFGNFTNFKSFFCVFIIVLIILWISFLFIQTISRNAEWSDPITFYEQTLAHAPTSLRVWNNLGMAYADKRMNDNAKYAYTRAIELNPQNPIPYHNMGNIYEDEKNIEMAKKYWQTAISLNPQFIQPQLKLDEYPKQ